MQNLFRFRTAASSPLFRGVLWVSTVALAAACSGSSSSDDDDDDDSAGSSGSSGKGGSSGRGGSSTVGTGGSTPGSGGSGGGSSGSSGSGGGTFTGQCQDVCEQASACSQTDTATCIDGCDQFDALMRSNICKAQIQAVYDCGSDAPDICADDVCSSESTDLVNCLVAYCTDNPNAAICAE